MKNKKEEIRRKAKENKERRIGKKKGERRGTHNSIWERFGHETGRHGSVRSKNQIGVSPRTRCVILKQS